MKRLEFVVEKVGDVWHIKCQQMKHVSYTKDPALALYRLMQEALEILEAE